MADDAIRIDTRIDTSSAEKDLEKLRSRLSSTAKEAQSGFSGADTAIKGMDTSTKGLTMSMSSLSKVIGSISIVAVLTKVAHGVKNVMATTEEAYASIRKASTMFGEVAVDEEAFVDRLSQIASETGADITALGEAAYQAMSAGIAPTRDMADVLAVVEKSARLASGGFTDTETAISSSLSVLNAYKMGVDQLDKVQGILLQTQNKGVTTVGQLGSALSKVTPTAAAFGLSFEEVATSIALMTKQGTNTDVATTALSSALSELGKSGTTASKNLEAAAQSAGLTGTSFSELIADGMNLSEILTLMSTYAEENGLSLVDMFGSIEAGRAALQLAGSNADEYNEILASMGDTAGLVGDAFEKTVTPSDKLLASLKNTAIAIGKEIKPVWDGLATALSTVLDKMTGQGDYAPTYEATLNNLAKASENLKKAQEEAGEEITATTLAMQFQSKVDFWTGIGKASDEYDKLNKSLTSLEKKQTSQQRLLDLNMNTISNAASNANLSVEQLTNQLALLKNGYIDVIEGVNYYDLKNLMSAYDAVGENKATVDSLGRQIEDTQGAIDSFVSSLAEMVNKGVISVSDIALVNSGLAAEVRTVVTQLQKEAKAVNDLNGAAKELSEGSEGIKSPIEIPPTDTLKKYLEDISSTIRKYEKLSEASDVLGDSYYSQEQYLKDLLDLYAQGLLGTEDMRDVLPELKKVIDEVTESIEDSSKETADWVKTLKGLGQDIAKGMLTSVSALFDEIFNKESRLKELTAELDDLSLTEKENLDAVATAEADLADARARMNERDIESAERKLDIAKSQLASTKAIISSVRDEKNAVENGSAGWKAYANTAMQALGSVLEALGHQLAAQAVLNIIEAPLAAAGYAAGAVAAYAAASWAKAQKFAQGGIVGGSSYAGDNVLARVNSGELILNMAQQDNVAKALSTLAEMSGFTGSGGTGVSVYMAGSTIYGLDEPAVGKAIYDNLQQLHYEGVL